MPAVDAHTYWVFKGGHGERKLLPFHKGPSCPGCRPSCPSCKNQLRAIWSEWIPTAAHGLGPLWTFTCGRKATERCLTGSLHLNREGQPVIIPRPTSKIPDHLKCWCGKRLKVEPGYYVRVGKTLNRVRCPNYRKALKDHHVSEVRDSQGQRVTLSESPRGGGWKPRCGEWCVPGRPLLSGCGALMINRLNKGHNRVKQAEVDTYYCNKPGCALRGRLFHWLRQPRRPYAIDRQCRLRREAREGRRPVCCKHPMYHRANKREKGPLRKFVCRQCGKTQWWDEAKGKPAVVERGTFQRKSLPGPRPHCKYCHKEKVVTTRKEKA